MAGVHIAFVDESGDVGTRGSPTRHFVLVAVVVEHARWAEANAAMAAMRGRLLSSHGLRLDAEMHASEFLGGNPLHLGLEIRARYRCAHAMLRMLGGEKGLWFARVAIRKQMAKEAVMDLAWECLLGEIACRARAARPACGSRGLQIICDHHAPTPYRPRERMAAVLGPECELLELPFGRDSADCQILQMADLLAFLTKQSLEPNANFQRHQGRSLLRRAERLYPGPCALIA